MKTVAIIMAGGSGERFWPLSRCAYPKQLLKIKDNRHMLSMAIQRIGPVVAPEDVYIVTVAPLVDAIQRETPEIPHENVIAEPEAKNTAACLSLASALISEKYQDDAVVIVLTADHFIHDERSFQNDCRAAAEFASQTDGLITFGIRPNRPETGYGYIEVGDSASNKFPIFRVNSFREKPDKETARRFLEDGDFSWNSGMFVWRNSVFQNELALHLPAMHGAIPEMREAIRADGTAPAQLAAIYRRLEKISIDVGLMERTNKVYVLRASFDWDDIGTWASLYRILPRDASGNAIFGNSVFISSENSIAYSINRGEAIGSTSPQPPDTSVGSTSRRPLSSDAECEAASTESTPPAPHEKLVIGYNLDNIIIVNTPDAVLVLPAEDVQKVKDIVAYLRNNGKEEYL